MSTRTKFPLLVLFLAFINLSLTNCTSPDTTAPSTTSPSTTSPGTTSPNTTSPETTSRQVAAATFSPTAGAYTSIQTVTISSTTSGASIRYTTDGSTPTETVGTIYSAPIRVATTETIKAIAYKAGLTDSTIATAAYSIGDTIPTPSFSPSGGTYSSTQSVTISDAASGAAIHYTTDGSTPTNSSAAYTGPITVAGNGTNETLKAIATKTGMTASSVGTATYIISYGQVSTPTFSPVAGTYSSDQSVTISCATSGAAIHYTTDGSTPTSSSAVYSAPIAVAGNGTNETIEAIATGAEIAASNVGTAIYAIHYEWQTIGTIGSGANQLKYPAGVVVDASGHIYVVDQGNSRIVRMDDMNGNDWITLTGTGHSDHLGGTNQFKYPAGVAVDALGHIYVVDQGNSRIVRMNDMRGSGWAAFGSFGSGTNQFINPAGVAVDALGHIYVVDQGNSRIVRTDDMNGTGWTAFGKRGSGTNHFKDPAGVALDARGRIYIADYANSRIVRMDDLSGTNWTSFGSSGSDTNQFKYPAGIAVDAIGHIFIADMINDRIVRMDDMSGTNWTTLGSAVSQFKHPWGVEVDAIGHIYIADMLNDRIVRFIIP